ncbi:MAG: B12-binding domain-containing radical SAM protein, partial [Candidatus Nanopelagicus sp.]
MYNIILFADTAYSYCIARSYGIQRVATELRNKGYSVLCVNYTSTLNFETYEKILDKAIGPETYAVGFSTTFFPYSDKEVTAGNNRRTVASDPNKSDEYNINDHPWFFESLSHLFTQINPDPWLQAVKKRNPKTKVIIGGTKSAEYINLADVDNVFLGYAETMIIEYMDSISHRGKRIIFNKVIDYDTSAAKDIWDFRSSKTIYTPEDVVLPNDLLGFEFARGCIFSCAFCSFPLIGRKNVNDYLKYKETIYDELMENYTKWGIDRYFIVDDTFNDSLAKLELINEIVKSLPFKPKFWAYARVDLFHSNPRMAELMYEIGVREINFGIETLHPETAKIIKKGNPEIKKKSLKLAREVWGKDVTIICNYIVGLPKETVSSVKSTCQWYIDEGYKYMDELSFNALTILQNFGKQQIYVSEIERNHEKYGYTLSGDTLGNWTKNDGSDIVSREQCLQLIKENHIDIKAKFGNLVYKNLFYLTTFKDLDPRLNFDGMAAMSD